MQQLHAHSASASDKSQRLQKDILRLGLCFRNKSNRIDQELGKLSKLSNEEKAVQIDRTIAIIIDEVISLSETKSNQDPLTKLAWKLESTGNQFNANGPILDGDPSTENAERLAREISDALLAPDPSVSAMTRFCDELPIQQSVRRELDAVKHLIVNNASRVESLNAFRSLLAQLSYDLHDNRPSGETNTADQNASRDLLLELMNLVDFPQDLVVEADEIRKHLSCLEASQDLETILNQIADLIERTRQTLETEIDRLTKFLATLSKRLENLDSLLASSMSIRDQSIESQDRLKHDFAKEVDGLRENIQSNKQANEIREIISNRLEKLSVHLSDYLAQEGERQEKSTAQSLEMQKTVSALESKTEKLHRDLEQQKVQLQIDPLTKILNRSGYNSILNDSIKTFRHTGRVFSIAVFDIDHFKKINDQFGHLAGDKVLANLAKQTKMELRATDSLCRYGGEEFVILMADTNAKDAFQTAEKLRNSIEKYHFHHGETSVPVTISCGTAEFRDCDNAESFFERADKALYRAKSSGRNRSIQAENS